MLLSSDDHKRIQQAVVVAELTTRGEIVCVIPVASFGSSPSLLLAISYTLCILCYIQFPGPPISHSSLAIFLSGFEFFSRKTFILGLIQSLGWGWYVARIFGPLYNFFALRK